ncbi:MAG: hypothetical protein KME25_06530 [Symplocastrum torsivum CPER-KK1]|jgi:hypothetical protein|uniref:Uncharacterized protein n=1 Tax=Symplocastrum torsivum CPER-KK1 TaxID=450513 RepID=A0A951PI79_9CYAN|nr:hypothetical protein [Symplocastrum torsivum CPER-KK1]
MSNSRTKQQLDNFTETLAKMPKVAPEGQNQLLWEAQRNGLESKISDLEQQLNGGSQESLAFEAFWQALEMPEKDSESQEDKWLAHRCKTVAQFAWIKAIEYQKEQ